MHRVGDETHIEVDEARGASTPHIVRYVLLFSLGLAVLAMSAVWLSRVWYDSPDRGDAVTAEEHALGG